MQIAIVGLAGCGKTTVFNTLTRGHAETGGYGGLQLNVGVVKVPDERLDKLAAVFKPKKIVHADVTYVDLPAPPASSEGKVGAEELPAEHLARLRDSDALIHVVRAWDSAAHPHPAGSVDPARDLEQLDLEFILADLAMVDRRLERLRGSGRHGTPAEREANEREQVILERLKPALEAGRPIRDEPLDADEEKALRGFRFLTQKPVLVLLNVGEGELADGAGAGRPDPRRLRPPARDGRRAVGEDRDGAGRAGPRRGRRVHGGAGARRVVARPGDRAVVPARRADLVPHRRAGRGPRLADPRRVVGGRRRRGDPHATSPAGSSAPRRSRTRTCWPSAPSPRPRRSARSDPRARPTG